MSAARIAAAARVRVRRWQRLPAARRARAQGARCRGAESFYTDPLMYQATSAGFLGPRDPVIVPSEDYGIDLEAELW
jgi:2-keto-4-pentenoate hydratase/2-oxohepta-3-ene-1,7-dioic acid hydratase in catechol pathway